MKPSAMWRAMAGAAGEVQSRARRGKSRKAEAQAAKRSCRKAGFLRANRGPNLTTQPNPFQFAAIGRHDSDVEPPDSEVDEAR